MSVKLGRYKYIATQGPCPEGFHIPLTSEWQALCGILTSTFGLASNATTMGTYLKMPAAGYRKYSTSNITNQGTLGRYWSSSRNDVDSAYRLYFSSSSINPQSNDYCTSGYSVRPFYNEGIAPNGGWQVLYQGSGSAGIYWHKDLGLITVSGNGTTWYTIADKNLGATNVYNSGDTLSEENCGRYFQWGNNHMFPFTGTLTTSTTQVNASTYGPGNRYDSSTFIIRTSSPYDWSSVRNDNLWGGVDGNVWKDVESIKYEWKPGDNTVFYVKGDGSITDSGPNNISFTSQNLSFETQGGLTYIKFGGTSANGFYTTSYNAPLPMTYNLWLYYDGGGVYAPRLLDNTVSNDSWCQIYQDRTTPGIGINGTTRATITLNKWYNIVVTQGSDGTTVLYINGQQQWSGSVTTNRYTGIIVGFKKSNNSDYFSGRMSNIILEDKARTADEIADYYNKTKGTYTGEGGGNDTVNGHQLDEHSMFPQGPCPDGYHVPLNSEWNKIKTFFSSCGILTGGNVCTYLKLAPDGYLSNTGTSKSEYNQYANSWSNYKGSGGTCARLSVGGPNYSPNYNTRPSPGGGIWSTVAMHIRPFKNLIVKPDSSWTTLYDGSSVATGAGIFWNSGLGLITIYDGGDYITIADKNLGATTVWDGGTTYNEANCGKFYQWGNNYAFPFSGQSPGSTTQVDASSYGPGNPYSSSTWINTGTTDWDSSHNGDLWGGVSKAELKQYYSFNLLNEYIGEYHECEVNTMGPCPSGFHIPTRQEWHDLYDIGYALGLWDTTNYGRQLQLQFNMPVCGKLNNDGTYTSSPTDAVYWCADKQSSSYGRDLWLRTTTDVATVDDDTTMIRGGSIRPFRNMPLIPTTSDSNWSIPTGSNPANGGIYDNETEGVISISADGAHWMTLADKNCGATTKWYLNSTMSEANCGKFYQWGNNHGFPFSGATKTSSTAVDASGYGPFSEYYDDDTFITTSPWDTSDNRNLWGGVSGPTRNCDISSKSSSVYFNDANWQEYQNLVDTIGSVQFSSSGREFEFHIGAYIGNRTALDFSANSNVMRTINLDTLTSTSKTLSVTMPDHDFKVWYFGDNRILTPKGLLDFDGNVITSFSYQDITPGDEGVVRACDSTWGIYKGIVNGDNITFTKIGTGGNDQNTSGPCIFYGRLGAYQISNNDTSGNGYSTYVNPSDDSLHDWQWTTSSRQRHGYSGPDGKFYRRACRSNGWGRFERVGTTTEGMVGESLSTGWLFYGQRHVKFLGNLVGGGMNSSCGTGTGYGSNNYFISTDGTMTKVQNNALAYGTDCLGYQGFIDEQGYIYPRWVNCGSKPILKTDKTFTDLNWKNPYLWR